MWEGKAKKNATHILRITENPTRSIIIYVDGRPTAIFIQELFFLSSGCLRFRWNEIYFNFIQWQDNFRIKARQPWICI